MIRKVVFFALGLMVLLLAAPQFAAAQGPLADLLLNLGEQRQVIQFNPSAALQKRIFADRFVPNSGEFRLTVGDVLYAGQRAEHLGTGSVRVYYAPVGEWGNVRFVQRGAVDGFLDHALLSEGESRQVIQFNPHAALQKRIFADGFVPNSGEFDVKAAGAAYSAQRAEHLGTGRVRVYYTPVGNWADVRYVERGQSAGAPSGPQFQPAPVFAKAMHDYPGAFMGAATHNYLGQAVGPASQTRVAEQSFGRSSVGDCSYPGSRLLWREDTRQIYLLHAGTGMGLHAEACRNFWQVFADTWQPGDPNNEDLTAPEGKVVPRGGIGKVWRQHFYEKNPTATEFPDAPERATEATVQQFENATAFYFPESGAIYVLFDRFHYLTRGGALTAQVWFEE